MKIYTKTGDKGETSLFTGERVPKHDSFMHALGTVDECNCAIGMAVANFPKVRKLAKHKKELIDIQHALFDLGAAIATPPQKASERKINKTRFDTDAIEKLETWIDEMDGELPPLKTFILPGGHPSAAALHLARSICRRAERHAVPLSLHGAIDDVVMIYLNRLSDYLFTLTRMVNHDTQTEETLWEHHKH